MNELAEEAGKRGKQTEEACKEAAALASCRAAADNGTDRRFRLSWSDGNHPELGCTAVGGAGQRNSSSTARSPTDSGMAVQFVFWGMNMTCFLARVLSTTLSIITSALLTSRLMAQAVPPDSSTDVEADETQPAGAPILVRITLRNTGKTAISYWCGGPAKYPGAHEFSARLTNGQGKTREAVLSNGQFQMGSGAMHEIQPGQSVTLPAALEPLPAGSYSIQVGKGKPSKIIVKDSPELTRQREQDILKRVRKGEPFAQHVAAKFPTGPVTAALLQDLLSADQQVALQAAFTLERTEKLPADSGAIVNKAMRMHLDATEKKQNRETSLLSYLTFLAARAGSDEALSAVLTLVHSNMDGGTRGSAIGALGTFKQDRAAKALRDLLKDDIQEVRFAAARALGERKDPAAVEVLLAVAGDAGSRWRAYAYPALAKFPTDARVESAIKNGLRDEDQFVRSQAEHALRELRRNQER
jgi:hypothetical protein